VGTQVPIRQQSQFSQLEAKEKVTPDLRAQRDLFRLKKILNFL